MRRRGRPLSGSLVGGASLVATSMALSLAGGCSAGDQTPVLVGGQKVDAHVIDERPLALLPPDALFAARLDVEAMARTGIGAQAGEIVTTVLPIGPESSFVPTRDVSRLYAAAYAMQGADFCAVAVGRFDVEAMRRAAQARARTAAGAVVVETSYGDYQYYTVANVGFVPLTARTLLIGNEIGMRRALDRLRFGRFEVALVRWMRELIEDAPAQPGQAPAEQPAFALAGDVGGQAVAAAASDRMPFTSGLTRVRILGNFASPGMNVVGSLTYRDAASAAQATAALAQLRELGAFVSWITALGFGIRVPEIKAVQRESDVALASSIDTATVVTMLRSLGQTLAQARPR
jgi:hypothetical protein